MASNHAKLNKGKLAEAYIIREKLGRGNFSVVRRVVSRENGKEFAAKIISTKSMSDQEVKDTHAEVDILGKVGPYPRTFIENLKSGKNLKMQFLS